MNSGCRVWESDKAVRLWSIVRELAVPERDAVDGPRLTRDLWDGSKFH